MSKSKQDDRVSAIMQVMKAVEQSPLSVSQYFQEHKSLFGRAQYYLYKKILEERGQQGLADQRHRGNNVKFTKEMKSFVKGVLGSDRSLTSSEIQAAIHNEFGVMISITGINDFRREADLGRISCSFQESGASEMVIALALASGFMTTITDAIYQCIQQKRGSESFRESFSIPKDHVELRVQGRFTSAYNTFPGVRESRFECLEDKCHKKRYASMKIFSRSKASFMRYSLALFALPLVTENGRIRSIDHPRGNALAYLCGYNYKAATLNTYLSELKYLQISTELIATTARFWIEFWSRRNQGSPLFACFYLDGNVKALWSSKSCHKGKVTMLGRVMNCLEQVFIHDGQGHPIYFQTFNGHADLGKHVLRMMDRISEYLQEPLYADVKPDTHLSVNRILIFDGGGNGVRTLRGLCASKYHFITILDANQVTERKLKAISQEKRYAYGDAWLVDCAIELEDSSEKGYLFETRAVQVHWDNGRIAVLVTSLSEDIFSPDHVVKSYFERWPVQELNFREMKSRVNLHRVVGYGKKVVDNPTVLEKIERLQCQIHQLEQALQEPLDAIRTLEEALQLRIKEERIYREKSQVVNGERTLSQDDARRLQEIQRDITRLQRKIKTIEQRQGKRFPSLKKKRTELARIIDKKKIYRVDVELDQIMTCFKISFANMCCYLLEECFDGEHMTLQRLFETIFELRGQMQVEGEQRHIFIKKNPKQKVIMKKLEHAFDVINHMRITDIHGYRYHFTLV
jgi:transposase